MQKELYKFIKGWCMVEFLPVMLPLQYEVSVNALEGFGDPLMVTVPNVAPVDVKMGFEVSLKDLEFTLISAVIGL